MLIFDGLDTAADCTDTVSRSVGPARCESATTAYRLTALSRGSLLCKALVPAGHRVVATSRPDADAVELSEFKARFVIYDMLPVSEQMLLQSMQMQLDAYPDARMFFDHIRAMANIRSTHQEV